MKTDQKTATSVRTEQEPSFLDAQRCEPVLSGASKAKRVSLNTGEARATLSGRSARSADQLRRKSKLTKGMFTSTTEDWSTPKALFDEYNREFHFTLDVCASDTNYKVKRYFTKRQNGLARKWEGVCWMNPPYGRGVEAWIKKAYEESKNGVVIVCLLPVRTDTRYFHEYIYNKAEIRFLKRRVRFNEGAIDAPFPSMIVVFNNRRNALQATA